MSNKKDQINDFKKAISSTLRAISNKKDIDINFGADTAIDSNSITLPLPSIKLEDLEKKEIRGVADSIALKFKYHDKNIHASLNPKSKVAKNIFDSIEDARYESLGIIEYNGIKNNLDQNMESKYKNNQANKLLDRNEVSIEDAVKLIIQEKLTNKILSKTLLEITNTWRY